MNNRILFKILVLTLVSSCYNDNEEDLYGPINCDVSEVTYSVNVQPIINSSCATTGCHTSGGTAPGNFNNYNELKSKVDNGTFENRVLIQKTMPPNSPLSDCELETLQAWIDGGALNN